MHVLHIIATLDPAAGGTSEAVRVLLEHAPPGYTAEVVTLDDPASPFLETLPFTVHPLGPQTSKYGYSPRLVPWLTQNRHRFQGVMVHGLWQYCGWAAWRALRGHVPYVVVPHGMLDPYFRDAFPLKHLKKWLYWLAAEYWVLCDSHCVLFTTHEESRLAKMSFFLHRWSARVVSFGADRPPGPSPEPHRAAFFATLPDLRERRFLLFLGRIHRKKGCDLLLQAFAKVAASDPALHLVMAGPDQQGWSAELRRMAAQAGVGERVHWPGMLHGSAKWGALLASEALILPSHQENFGMAVAEALACARPALLSRPVNIASEVLEDGAGFVEDDTARGTESLLRRWIAASDAERKAMGYCALQCFNKRYDMERNAEVISRLFEQPGCDPSAAARHASEDTARAA